MRKIFPYLILLVALLISATSGYYSIIGLTRLFAGAVFEIIVLGIVLELAKVIITTSLQRYWSVLNLAIKTYLMIAIAVLMIITSAGIYGFLSSAYQNTIIADSITTKIGTNVDNKIDRYITSKTDLTTQYSALTKSIAEMQQAGTQYNDRFYTDAIRNRDKISIKIDRLNDSIEKYDYKKLNTLTNDVNKSQELSSLKYISKLSGIEMDRVLNYFLLLIIFVFDPLAIMMLLVYNSIQIKSNIVKDPEPVDDEPEVYSKPSAVNEEIVEQPTIVENSVKKKVKLKNDSKRFKQPNNSKASTNTSSERNSLESKEIVHIREDDVGNILTPEQIKNMSHQTIKKILSRKNT